MAHALTRGSRGALTPQFGSVLRALRDDRRLSQGTLARRLQRSTSFISLLESGHRQPTRELINELMSVLKVTPEEEEQLLEAAGLIADSLESAVERMVNIIAEQTAADEVDRSLILADLTATTTGWREALLGARFLCDGDFRAAENLFAQLAAHKEYTPTLKTFITCRRADPLLPRGKFTLARRLLQQARALVEKLAGANVPWAPLLRGEVATRQAIVAMREGLYGVAEDLLDETQSLYARHLYGSPVKEAMAALCYGRDYRLRAQLALLQGEAPEALTYCFSAETYLSRATPSATRAHALRRTQSLKAWAYAKLPDSNRAIELHTQARQACESAGDHYGVITNWLYLGDDYRYALEALVNDEGPSYDVERCAPAARRAHLRQALAPAEARLREALEAYEQAQRGLESMGDKMLLGRCLRCLAIIQRFSASLAPAEEATRLRNVARANLERALEIDRELGQGRRIPGIYATFAEVVWDQDDVASALNYLRAALDALNSPLIKATDPAAQKLRDWVLSRMEALSEYASRIPDAGPLRWGLASDPGAPPEWRAACESLVETVYQFLYLQHGELRPRREEDEEWHRQMLAVEALPGPRILAQNTLSVSLSSRLPGGFPGSVGPLHVQRHQAFLQRAEEARDPGGRERNHDLCYREAVRQALDNPASEVLVEAQLRQAADLMRRSSAGYLLDTALFKLPLAFEVKGSHVLFEIQGELARRLAMRQAGRYGEPLCYSVEDGQLAQQLRQIFFRLVELTRPRVPEQATSIEWLHNLLHARPQAIGSPQRL